MAKVFSRPGCVARPIWCGVCCWREGDLRGGARRKCSQAVAGEVPVFAESVRPERVGQTGRIRRRRQKVIQQIMTATIRNELRRARGRGIAHAAARRSKAQFTDCWNCGASRPPAGAGGRRASRRSRAAARRSLARCAMQQNVNTTCAALSLTGRVSGMRPGGCAVAACVVDQRCPPERSSARGMSCLRRPLEAAAETRWICRPDAVCCSARACMRRWIAAVPLPPMDGAIGFDPQAAYERFGDVVYAGRSCEMISRQTCIASSQVRANAAVVS